MAVTDITTSPTETKPYLDTDRMEVIRVALAGAVAGLLVPLLALAIANWIISPIFCHANQGFSICSQGGVVAYHIAGVMVALAGVALLANWSVFRPLPLVLAVTVAMWGFNKFVNPLVTGAWIEYFLFSVALTMLCYLLFYWLLRLRNFPVSITITVVAAGLVCWAIIA